MEIKEFNKTNLKELSVELGEILKPFAEKYGLVVVQGNGRYSPLSWSKKLEFKIVDTVEQKAKAKAEFEKYASFYGLNPSDHGRMIKLNGKYYEIVGLKIGASKRSVIIQQFNNNKTYVTSPEIAKEHFVAVK